MARRNGGQARGGDLGAVSEAGTLGRRLLGCGGLDVRGATQLILRGGSLLGTVLLLGLLVVLSGRYLLVGLLLVLYLSGGRGRNNGRRGSRCGGARAHRGGGGGLLIGTVLHLGIHRGDGLVSRGSRCRGAGRSISLGFLLRLGGSAGGCRGLGGSAGGCRGLRAGRNACRGTGALRGHRTSLNLHGRSLAAARGVVILQGTREQVHVNGDAILQVALPGNRDGKFALIVGGYLEVVLTVNLNGALVELNGDGRAGGAVLGQEALAGNLEGFALVPDLGDVGGGTVLVFVSDGLAVILSEGGGDGGHNQTATDEGRGTEASDSVSNVHSLILAPGSKVFSPVKGVFAMNCNTTAGGWSQRPDHREPSRQSHQA